ncbi:hypothetical protein PV387_04435 [Streptomyces sp. ME02-6987-2C]|uniref:hypothetical protein n=1 Tax=Streptomyces TaxID=1883 RepID=UPI00087A935A|nr:MULTISPECIES: hypothetical protein [unclassified Streptomyces]MDX3365279.1 hypothetical protein [Streptomyces sp. ME02-6987-2C]MDX3422723.1 hypothetical protein [Streptomyces sp. ME02-6985-2c]REH20616.1 hypothetical protein BX268_2400 [Streptomyces sp. 2221.1]SDT30291.1 hypothetical protein SAMN05428941_2395 [Streptomyces sp. 2114.2]
MTRLLITDFRGWKSLDLRPRDHAVVAGVPRAGRSDVIEALARVLDPEAAHSSSLSDLHQTAPVEEAGEDQSSQSEAGSEAGSPESAEPLRASTAEVEVTLSDLDPEIEQLVDGYLQPLDETGMASEDDEADPSAPQCVRLTYRLSYDHETEALESVVYYPARSNPETNQFLRVPAAVRRVLPVITLNAGVPLQLRAGGSLRRYIEERDPKAAVAAFEVLRDAVGEAVAALSKDPAITEAVDAVLAVGGTGKRLGDSPLTAGDIGFLAEDGSVSALLRTLRAALRLDTAGPLALTNHGSTVTAILSMAEAMLLADVPGAVVLADDFGDQLDAATAEHLASLIRNRSGQAWLSTRRPEVARAFEPGEVVRLVRHGGQRTYHQLPQVSDRKQLVAHRQLHTQLLPALTAPVVAVTEGPHDVAVLGMANRRYPPHRLPLSAYGVRLVAAGTGSDGGIDQVPQIADLAKQLGFRVIGVVDADKPSQQSADQLDKVKKSCDVLIQLPAKTAIERAITAGVRLVQLAAASSVLSVFGQPDPLATEATEQTVTSLCVTLHKKGLHEPFLDALYRELQPDPADPEEQDEDEAEEDVPVVHPPLLAAILDAIATAASSSYSGPTVIVLEGVGRPDEDAA